jgi:hypothetical protein
MRNAVAKLRSGAARAANRVFQVVGLQLVRTTSEMPFDATFARWIAEAKRSGVDPNDIGDQTGMVVRWTAAPPTSFRT